MCLLEEVAKLPFGVSWRIFSSLFCPGCDFGLSGLHDWLESLWG